MDLFGKNQYKLAINFHLIFTFSEILSFQLSLKFNYSEILSVIFKNPSIEYFL
ncbi:hypothetical protein SAMN05421825_0636 [Epilithonimonas hungarica]|uniref:Uncharacterized protein n=1 Tax=Epilithonimonas hungarica TaxID=454006 RepID=A0A1G7H067_9FLAO|nr:hypothetical protein [Epilithonimonas hungarica]SDE93713.1 hypothetical protein SAMN05421825_0636 [Epilithonimonas hungarica]